MIFTYYYNVNLLLYLYWTARITLFDCLIYKDNERILEMQSREVKLRESKRFSNIPAVLAIPEDIKSVDADVLVEALENKYDTLKDKLILDALEKQMGAADWAQMNERERQQELMKIKLQEKRLKQEGLLRNCCVASVPNFLVIG